VAEQYQRWVSEHQLEMEYKYVDMKRVLLCLALPMLSIVVAANLFFSKLKKETFSFGSSVSTTSGVTRVLDCIVTCGDTCDYVQYMADGTCVLYADALLLTEPATVEGQVQGYRKVRFL